VIRLKWSAIEKRERSSHLAYQTATAVIRDDIWIKFVRIAQHHLMRELAQLSLLSTQDVELNAERNNLFNLLASLHCFSLRWLAVKNRIAVFTVRKAQLIVIAC
jgi:hypothetical protein